MFSNEFLYHLVADCGQIPRYPYQLLTKMTSIRHHTYVTYWIQLWICTLSAYEMSMNMNTTRAINHYRISTLNTFSNSLGYCKRQKNTTYGSFAWRFYESVTSSKIQTDSFFKIILYIYLDNNLQFLLE